MERGKEWETIARRKEREIKNDKKLEGKREKNGNRRKEREI